ncbi:MAG: PTS sugar transporter subunit IIA [Planctomycetes bacterium]|nr:PTS sugar transporter subunit IIA [Planctomycetota bacterium]
MADHKIELKIHDLKASDRFEAIRELMHGLAVQGGMDAAEAGRIEEEILERERLASTAIGHGVAIPHARVTSVAHVRAVLGRSVDGIAWAAPDDRPVHLVFQFISPRIGIQIHTEMLARIARLAQEQEFNHVTIRNLEVNDLWELLDNH